MESYIYILGGLVVGSGLGFLLARALRKEDTQAAVLLSDNATLQQEVSRLRLEAESKEQTTRQALEKAAGLEAKNATLLDNFVQMQDQMRMQFENLARQIFEENSNRFSEQSKKGLGDLLNPLKERLVEFQTKVDKSFGDQAKEQFALKNEIERIVKVSQTMNMQTENLTKALKGDVKAQGNWGEIVLERILEESGLREGVEYYLQGSGLGLKDNEGRVQKPDVVIVLPEGKHIIIDSKVSLTHYERYVAEEDEVAKKLALKNFIESLRQHVVGLSGKRYEQQGTLGSPDFVLMFTPIEGAYSLAVQQDPGLHPFAWEKKIVLVCPSTLFATLRTIASVWKNEMQNRNVQEIARQGGALYDKFVGFIEDMTEIGDRLKQVDKAYDKAKNKLVDGTGSLISRTENLRKLGAKTTKQLPKELVEEIAIQQLEKSDA
jgi:DNA recombination protein RmuC